MYNVSKIYLYCSIFQYFVSFHCCIIFHYMDIPFFTPSLVDAPLCYFYFMAAMNIRVHHFVWTHYPILQTRKQVHKVETSCPSSSPSWGVEDSGQLFQHKACASPHPGLVLGGDLNAVTSLGQKEKTGEVNFMEEGVTASPRLEG